MTSETAFKNQLSKDMDRIDQLKRMQFSDEGSLNFNSMDDIDQMYSNLGTK